MNSTETAVVVAYMAEAWPWAEWGDHAVELWADACPTVEQRTAAEAARRLVRSEERPPSVARFLQECRLIAREQAQPAIATGPMHHSSKTEAAQKIAGLRGYWAEASAGRPEHRGCIPGTKPGQKGPCPRCSTTEEFIAQHAPTIAQWLRDFRVES